MSWMHVALYASLFVSPLAAALLALRGGAPWWSLPLSIARMWALVLVAPLALLMFIATQFADVRREDALRVLEELKEESRRKYVSPYTLATAYGALGEKDLAFEWLEIAYRDRSEYMASIRVDPKIDAIRDDPRFLDLVRCMGYGL